MITTIIKRTVYLSKSLLCFKKEFSFLQTKLTQQKLKELRTIYARNPTLNIFKEYITNNSDYFKIFQLLQRSEFSEQSYQQLKQQTTKISVQNDNLRLLRGKITARIAQHFSKSGRIKEADMLFNEAIQIFQQSLIPQVMPYYSVYRKYGFFLFEAGQLKKAAEILSQSVQILREYVANSDDPVTANYNSIQQARACTKLIQLLPQQRQKWLKLANQYWKECEEGFYDTEQYAQTVYENCLDKIKMNAKKARIYAQIQIQKIANPKFQQIILKAFPQEKE